MATLMGLFRSERLVLKKTAQHFLVFLGVFFAMCWGGMSGRAIAAGQLGIEPETSLKIELTQGKIQPASVAIAPMLYSSNRAFRSLQLRNFVERIHKVILADFERSGLIKFIPRSLYVEDIKAFDHAPYFPDWHVVGARAVLITEIGIEDDNRFMLRVRLWDVVLKKTMIGLQYLADVEDWRVLAHKIADSVYSRVTGEDPYFNSRVVFVAETGKKDSRKKRIAVMDSDGKNIRYVTNGRSLVLTPRFSPTKQKIAYLTYATGLPHINILNLNTGEQIHLDHIEGMTFAPKFSPNGTEIALSLINNGNTDIYLRNLKTGKMRQITKHLGIDTAPDFSPDGKKMTFESNRGGSQQIYIMDVDGGNVRRLTYGDGSYGTPAWSPRGDLIAFTKIQSGIFYIGVIRTDGTRERVLSKSFLDEGPTWSPNGRVLMFFRETPGTKGQSSLYTIDITGELLQQIQLPVGASDPAWGALIK
jgi:TolB protein